jgi:hypothetical protein
MEAVDGWLHAMLAGREAEVAALSLAHGIATFPPPSAEEGSRSPVPMTELVAFHPEMARQLGS